MIGIVVAAALAAAQDPSPSRADPGSEAPFRWARVPDEKELSNNYPLQAAGTDLAARVMVACSISPAGSLEDCKIESEDPPGMGFGEAALRSVVNFRAEQMESSRPMAGYRVRIPMIFSLRSPDRVPLIQFRHPQAPRGRVDVDCRYRAAAVDNCIIRRTSPRNAELDKLAMMLVTKLKLEKLPRGQGRVLIPIEFVPEAAKGR